MGRRGNASGVLRGWEGGWVDDEHDDIRVMRYGHSTMWVWVLWTWVVLCFGIESGRFVSCSFRLVMCMVCSGDERSVRRVFGEFCRREITKHQKKRRRGRPPWTVASRHRNLNMIALCCACVGSPPTDDARRRGHRTQHLLTRRLRPRDRRLLLRGACAGCGWCSSAGACAPADARRRAASARRRTKRAAPHAGGPASTRASSLPPSALAVPGCGWCSHGKRCQPYPECSTPARSATASAVIKALPQQLLPTLPRAKARVARGCGFNLPALTHRYNLRVCDLFSDRPRFCRGYRRRCGPCAVIHSTWRVYRARGDPIIDCHRVWRVGTHRRTRLVSRLRLSLTLCFAC